MVLHDDRVSRHDVLCGANVLPVDFLACLSAAGARPLCLLAKAAASNPEEVSIHVSLAQRFGFANRQKATIELIEDYDAVTATHVELFFREQHLSRADMWRIMQRLDGSVVYNGQKVNYLGSVAAEIEAIHISGRDVDSAFVTQAKSKPIFTSGSARYTLLIQISKEMLEYWMDGDLMYERLLTGYLPELFQGWDQLKVRHQVSVVLFGRSEAVAARQTPSSHEPAAARVNITEALDFFHVIASDVTSSQWPELVRKLKRAFNGAHLPRQVCLAAKGNMLEALHMAAMSYTNDNIDPQLSSTGTSIIAITAGAGLFETSHRLLKDTTHLLVGNSIGVDIVALSPKPLHPVPLFSYHRDGECEYALPHWVDISLWKSARHEFVPSWMLHESDDHVDAVTIAAMHEDQGAKVSSTAAAMESHDDTLFGYSSHGTGVTNASEAETQRISADSKVPPQAFARHLNGTQGNTHAESHLSTEAVKRHPVTDGSLEESKGDTLPRRPLMSTSRKISLGPRGLAPGRGAASTTVSVEHAQQGRDLSSSPMFSPNESSSGLAKQIRASLARKPSHQSLNSQPRSELTETTRPIDIQAVQGSEVDIDDPTSLIEQRVLATVSEGDLVEDGGLSETPRAKRDPFYAAMKAAQEEGHWTTSPWVTLLNPCNPKRGNMRVAAQYRKWQHVFPKAVSSATFKWRSMCSPAALPLTTEYRPSLRELEKYPMKRVRRLLVSMTNTAAGGGSQHVLEQLVLLRLTHGFQIAELQDATSKHSGKTGRLLMSLGNLHHEFQCLSDAEIQVVEYNQDSATYSENDERHDKVGKYAVRIRSAAASRAVATEVSLTSTRQPPDWSKLDDQLIANDRAAVDQSGSRMRFVLIPVEPPRAGQAALSDEERRIDGIQKLTQLWQRNRYVTAEDQRHHASLVRPKTTAAAVERDPNPLAIEYQTRDPSAVVNAYGPALTGQLDSGETVVPLFAESESYHSSTFDVAKLVKQMQEPPPHGVEVRDRRWFARLHFKCFRGDEMVNWLMRVFKDLHTREDAMAIGNELMRRGIFSHVRHKHDFRDGNYFYQITSAHRTTDYPDTASMFAGKGSLRSVPSTPIAESRSSPMMRPIFADSDSAGKLTPTITPADKKVILLSQMMMCNVDPTKKSDQLEIVNLHYDRIHNPENCYHVQLEWVNTTAKLIRDAVTRWTTLTETHGLRLVQVPLAEACKLRTQHPFDQPVYIKLAVTPPEKIMATPVLDPHTFAPPPVEDSLAYQKALLRRMDFILDYEAAASFTTKLDVSYSYGRPEYDLTQFVHKSGLLLAQICGDEKSDFLLVPNRLASSQQRSSASGKQHTETSQSVEDIVKAFTTLCRDEKALKAFYEEANKVRLPPPSPFLSDISTLDSDVPPMQLPPHLAHRVAMRGLH